MIANSVPHFKHISTNVQKKYTDYTKDSPEVPWSSIIRYKSILKDRKEMKWVYIQFLRDTAMHCTTKPPTGKWKQKFSATARVYGDMQSPFQVPYSPLYAESTTLSGIGWFWFKFSSKAVTLRNCLFKKHEVSTGPGKWLDLATPAHILWSTNSWRKAAPPTLGRSMADPLPHSHLWPSMACLLPGPSKQRICNPSFEEIQNNNSDDKTPNFRGY